MNDALIVSATRSPIARAFKGSLVGVRPTDLAAAVTRAALDAVPALDPNSVEDIILGCAQPAGEQGYNMARVVSLLAGLEDVPGTTVNRYCASSLQALRMAFHGIRAGEGEVYLAGGVECVSRFKFGKSDGLPDTKNPRFDAPGMPAIYMAMGETAERVADAEDVSRADMDAWAATSQTRAVAARDAGFFAREITPIDLPDGGQMVHDECPRAGTTIEKLAGLRTVFREDGRVTAGNACPLNDGAAAMVVMASDRAAQLGIEGRARIIATAVTALDPALMGMGPVEATRAVLKRAKMTMDDVDLVELNEAFAAQVVPCMRHLAIPPEKLNAHGGAIALGHPFGMTGVRLVTTLLNGLESTDGSVGLATLCVGGGQGMALLIERLG